jgi:hypothetical protein
MLIPLLVRLTDSQVNLLAFVVPEASDRINDVWRISEQVRARRVWVDQQTPMPNLDIDPVHGNIQFRSEFRGAEKRRRVMPPRSLRR